MISIYLSYKSLIKFYTIILASRFSAGRKYLHVCNAVGLLSLGRLIFGMYLNLQSKVVADYIQVNLQTLFT